MSLQTLLNTKIETNAQIAELLNVDVFKVSEEIKNLIQSGNVDDVKAVALKFNDPAMFDCEDRLCELMGEDEYFDWADENNIA